MNAELPPDVIERHNSLKRALGMDGDWVERRIERLKAYMAETLEEIDRSDDPPGVKAELRERITEMYEFGIRELEKQRFTRHSAQQP